MPTVSEGLKRIALEKIDEALQDGERSVEKLHALLKCACPGVTLEEVRSNKKKRDKAVTKLRALCHPDKYAGLSDLQATLDRTSKGFDAFVADCIAGRASTSNKKRFSTSTSSRFPPSFSGLKVRSSSFVLLLGFPSLAVKTKRSRGVLNAHRWRRNRKRDARLPSLCK